MAGATAARGAPVGAVHQRASVAATARGTSARSGRAPRAPTAAAAARARRAATSSVPVGRRCCGRVTRRAHARRARRARAATTTSTPARLVGRRGDGPSPPPFSRQVAPRPGRASRSRAPPADRLPCAPRARRAVPPVVLHRQQRQRPGLVEGAVRHGAPVTEQGLGSARRRRRPGRRPSAARAAAAARHVEDDGGRGGPQHHHVRRGHPFVEPSVRPATKCLCSTKNTSSTGSAASTEPADTQVVVGEELAAQVVQRAGDGQLAEVLDQHGRPEELVVDPGGLQHRERGQRRPDQRQGQLPELPGDARAVELGRLVDLERQRLHVVAQHEGAEARAGRRR